MTPSARCSLLFRAMQRTGQRENYLTQALAAGLNVSPRFRAQFCASLGLTNDVRKTRVTIQETLRGASSDRRSICDAVIWSHRKKIAVIEVKFDAILSEAQLRNYDEHLKSNCPADCIFVLLSRTKMDEFVGRHVRSRAVTNIVWRDVYESLAAAIKAARQPERFILEDLMAFISEEDQIPRSLSRNEMSWLKETFNFLKGSRAALQRRTHVHSGFEAISIACLRLENVRDAVWASLADEGWTPFSAIYADRESKTNEVWLTAGYYVRPKTVRNRKLVSTVSLCLEARFSPHPRLSVTAWAYAHRAHPLYERNSPWIQDDEYDWTRKSSGEFFTQEFDQVKRRFKKVLAGDLAKFRNRKKSFYLLAQ